ncbi:MAG: hypothetical protein IT249_20430 [Chitinophagaceae bacterium]|nr:hypothetical protein [Chitinophagaceae bacterium]
MSGIKCIHLRQLTAISLLCVMIFNLVGYQLLLQCWNAQKQHELEMLSITRNTEPQEQAISARDEFSRLVNELQKNATKKSSEQNNSGTIKFSFSDYTVQQTTEYSSVIETSFVKFYSSSVHLLPSPAAASPGQPPDFNS